MSMKRKEKAMKLESYTKPRIIFFTFLMFFGVLIQTFGFASDIGSEEDSGRSTYTGYNAKEDEREIKKTLVSLARSRKGSSGKGTEFNEDIKEKNRILKEKKKKSKGKRLEGDGKVVKIEEKKDLQAGNDLGSKLRGEELVEEEEEEQDDDSGEEDKSFENGNRSSRDKSKRESRIVKEEEDADSSEEDDKISQEMIKKQTTPNATIHSGGFLSTHRRVENIFCAWVEENPKKTMAAVVGGGAAVVGGAGYYVVKEVPLEFLKATGLINFNFAIDFMNYFNQ